MDLVVAEQDGRIIGVMGLKSASVVTHFFVDPRQQRGGIARRLWERAQARALASCKSREISVRANPPAVLVYERLGFKVQGPASEEDGLPYVPMLFRVDDQKTTS
jgi:GNAT superfamily N-acetyltransferase